MYNVYVRGFVGNFGTKVLIEEKKNELLKYFSNKYIEKVKSDLRDGLSPSLFIDKEISDNLFDKEKIGKGGFLAALWKICDRNKVGLKYDLSKVPIIQGTVEIANFFDINPYRLLTANVEILFIDNNYEIIDNKNMKKIGETNNTKQRIRTDIETKSFLTKCYKDDLFNIIDKNVYNRRIMGTGDFDCKYN